jgi:Rrf2 family iron-sulfur cluster assembly transcriptional regulator
MRLTSKARYAVMAMVDIGDEETGIPVSLSAISERQELPLPYLEQLFVKLRKNSLVKSVRGSSGGYVLGRSADQIRILDIIVAVNGPLKATRCDQKSALGCQAAGRRCSVHDLWDELEAVVQRFLSQVTLADVCAKRVSGLGRFALFPDMLPVQNVSPVQIKERAF